MIPTAVLWDFFSVKNLCFGTKYDAMWEMYVLFFQPLHA